MALVLISLRFFLSIYKLKDNDLKISNIQNLGDREYQSNYFTVLNKHETTLVVLADGIIDTKNGRLSAILAVDIFKTNFMKKNFKSFSEFFETSKQQIQKYLNDNIISSNNRRVFLTVLEIENDIIQCKNEGNKVLVYRNKELIHLDSSKFVLEPKDIIMVASNGAMENLKEVYIHWYLGLTDLSLKEKGFQLQKKVLEVLKSQNSTIILLEVPTKNLGWEKKVYED